MPKLSMADTNLGVTSRFHQLSFQQVLPFLSQRPENSRAGDVYRVCGYSQSIRGILDRHLFEDCQFESPPRGCGELRPKRGKKLL